MVFDSLRWFVSRRPGAVIAAWLTLLALILLLAPDLTKIAAEGQAELLPEDSESAHAARDLELGWPGQWSESSSVVGFYRPDGLTTDDRAYAQSLVDRFRATGEPDRPEVLGAVLGPDADPDVLDRLLSDDGTMLLSVVAVDSSFVSPSSRDAVAWLHEQAGAVESQKPAGLKVLWTGGATLGDDYMDNVTKTLDRAALLTVFLLLIVLFVVYRSLVLALVPLLTIGVGLLIARGVLAAMATVGWEISSLVELFLVVVLFGCGTDFCLLLTWRFGENWNAGNPRAAIRTTLGRVALALVTSAGTTIVGLMLMGTTKFKLFSSTGPSVSIGLAIIVIAALSLTPAMLLYLARYRPRSFKGLTRPPSGFYHALGSAVLHRPWLSWAGTLALMLPFAAFGLKLTAENRFLQDTVAEMPSNATSVRDYRLVAEKFGPGRTAPLTIVLRTDEDLRAPETVSTGLAMIDDVSRFLNHQSSLAEVRSATQPLGSTAPLDPARLSARLEAINTGFAALVAGAKELQDGLNLGAARIRVASRVGELTGQDVLGTGNAPAPPSGDQEAAKPAEAATADAQKPQADPVMSGLRRATTAMLGQFPGAETVASIAQAPPAEATGPVAELLRELTRAADGAGQIADGAGQARREIANILEDPVGRRALDRLLINEQTIEENPEILRSLDYYLGHPRPGFPLASRLARIEVEQTARPLSPAALEQVETIRRRLRDYVREYGPENEAIITGSNADAADIRTVTRRDQYKTWVIVPLGVFLVLVVMLREPFACINLVGTMLLTYCFALGVTHMIFCWGFGYDGLDWKVPYFLFVLLVAVGVDYNVFLMSRLQEEVRALGLKAGITKAIGQTGGLITSAAAITACSFAAMMVSPLASLRQLGFALVVGIITDAVLVRPVLVPCGQWLINHGRERRRQRALTRSTAPLPRPPKPREPVLS